jgi:hypothetical protein
MQREDHKKYDAGFDPSGSGIPMQSRGGGGDPWDSRPSMDSLTAGAAAPARSVSRRTAGGGNAQYGHLRQDSAASVATMLTEKPVEHARYQSFDTNSGYPAQPSYAYTQEPEPTPYYQTNYYGGGASGAGMNRPEAAQAHPAEGSFGRKTPRQPSGDQYAGYYDRR